MCGNFIKFARVIFVAILACAFGDVSSAQSKSKSKSLVVRQSPFVPPGYKVTFQDEFDGKELDLNKWNYRQLGERDGTIVSKDAVKLDGKGQLLLATLLKENKLHWGMVSTEKSYLQKYGYFEARIKFQYQQGVHGAFWLQSPTYGKVIDDLTASGVEIDIVEFFGAGRNDGGVQAALHWNGYDKNHKSLDHKPLKGVGAAQSELSSDFHIYALEWSEQGYRFLIDGTEFYRTTEAVSHRDEYVILSIGSSSWERDRIKPTELPAVMAVDYVRVYASSEKGSTK